MCICGFFNEPPASLALRLRIVLRRRQAEAIEHLGLVGVLPVRVAAGLVVVRVFFGQEFLNALDARFGERVGGEELGRAR